MHEVDAPDMVLVLWSEADDRTILVVEPFAFLMALWELQAFLTPEPLDPPRAAGRPDGSFPKRSTGAQIRTAVMSVVLGPVV